MLTDWCGLEQLVFILIYNISDILKDCPGIGTVRDGMDGIPIALNGGLISSLAKMNSGPHEMILTFRITLAQMIETIQYSQTEFRFAQRKRREIIK